MWRKLVQSTYRRKGRDTGPPETYFATRPERAIFVIGALANVWTGIEDLLDKWVDDIHSAGGSQLIQAQLPPNLDRELDYLAAALKAGLIPKSRCEEAGRLIQDIHRIKGFRHTVIHGSLLDVREGMTSIFEHSRVRGAKRIRTRVTIAQVQMTRHYERAFRLLSELSTFLTGEDVTKASG